jgi:hypothetical protein
LPRRAYTDDDLDAAIGKLSDPQQLREAQDLVSRAAPSLQRVLDQALAEGGWFDSAHEAAIGEAVGVEDPDERMRAMRTLLAEETRLGMFVGVAVGFELSRTLSQDPEQEPKDPQED